MILWTGWKKQDRATGRSFPLARQATEILRTSPFPLLREIRTLSAWRLWWKRDFVDDLEKAKDSLADTKNQFETAQKEVQKPFVQEEELKSKLARLDELNILLNMDKKENEIVGGEPDEGESTEKRKEKSY